MSTLTTYKGLSVLTSASGAGGSAINSDFTNLADRIGPCNYTATTDPTSSDNESSIPPYYVGSRWMNQTAGTEWVCIASSMSAATWQTTTVADDLGNYLPLSGGTMSGNLSVSSGVIIDSSGDLHYWGGQYLTGPWGGGTLYYADGSYLVEGYNTGYALCYPTSGSWLSTYYGGGSIFYQDGIFLVLGYWSGSELCYPSGAAIASLEGGGTLNYPNGSYFIGGDHTYATIHYFNGNTFVDSSSQLYYSNGDMLADASGNLYVVPQASLPSSPTKGMLVCLDGSPATLNFYNGSSWVALG